MIELKKWKLSNYLTQDDSQIVTRKYHADSMGSQFCLSLLRKNAFFLFTNRNRLLYCDISIYRRVNQYPDMSLYLFQCACPWMLFWDVEFINRWVSYRNQCCQLAEISAANKEILAADGATKTMLRPCGISLDKSSTGLMCYRSLLAPYVYCPQFPPSETLKKP
jgi:hypothetical protein